MIEVISSALEKNGIKSVNMFRDYEKWGEKQFTPQELMRCTFQEIDRSDLLLIELSEKGVGLGIEAGYAFAKKVPIVIVARTGSDISTTLQGIAQEVIFYDEPQELTHKLGARCIRK